MEEDWILANDVEVSTNDTLVIQTRESNKRVHFTPKYVKIEETIDENIGD